MRPGILPEHGFKHIKGNHYATLPWFGTKIAQKYAKRIKTNTWSTQVFVATWNATFSRSQIQGNFRATSGQNVLYMRSDVSKEMSRFRLPSSGRRRLLLKVPSSNLANAVCEMIERYGRNIKSHLKFFTALIQLYKQRQFFFLQGQVACQ